MCWTKPEASPLTLTPCAMNSSGVIDLDGAGATLANNQLVAKHLKCAVEAKPMVMPAFQLPCPLEASSSAGPTLTAPKVEDKKREIISFKASSVLEKFAVRAEPVTCLQ